MTLSQSRQIVLTSIAKELEQTFGALYGHMQKGLIRSNDAPVLACEVEALDSLMGYVRHESERIRADRVREVVSDVDAMLRPERNND
jgi:hypothetical protein